MRHLTPEILLKAYRLGSFPMASDRDDPVLHWLDPPLRGILPLDAFHVPKSLRKVIRRGTFEVQVDGDFAGVIRACSEPTATRPRTWLNDELIGLYCELHRRGHAHSVETRFRGQLTGGLYGVRVGGAFFGESMFSRATDASKVALAELVARLRAGGFELLDTQFITDHLTRFGAIEVTRAEYKRRLRGAILRPALFPTGPGAYCGSLPGSIDEGADGGDAGGWPGASIGSAHSSTQTS